MIAKKNHSIRYLTRQDIADIHADLSEQVLSDGSEPLPDFRYGKQEAMDALIAAPQQRFYGRDAYPTLAEKAAIIFYMVNRRHIFPNGNKRLSTLCLLTFLIGNDAQLDVSPQELTEKALWLATADAEHFPLQLSAVPFIQGFFPHRMEISIRIYEGGRALPDLAGH